MILILIRRLIIWIIRWPIFKTKTKIIIKILDAKVKRIKVKTITRRTTTTN